MKKIIQWSKYLMLLLAANANAAVEDVLTQVHVCSDTIVIRSESLSSSQQQQACNLMSTEEAYFHSVFGTVNSPVPDDNNTSLRANVYSNSSSYQTYAGGHFNISTNNGGMYLEGIPSTPGNQAEFIAYESGSGVLNLEHEYVHYLDGRFNLYGDFCDMLHDEHSPPENCPQPSPSFPHLVWWVEGVAEYISKKNNNSAAVSAAASHSYSLSDLFNTSYNANGGTNRVYTWGYLSVRFMMERQRNQIENMLALLRVGNFNGYQNLVKNTWGTSFNAEFNQWLDCIAGGSNNCGGGSSSGGSSSGGSSSGGSSSGGSSSGGALQNGQTVTGLSAATNARTSNYYIDVPSGASNLSIKISGGTGDADLYVKKDSVPTDNSYDCRPYTSGNSETCGTGGSALPTSTGRFYINVKAYSAFSGVNLTASFTSGGSSSGGSSSGGSSSGGSSSGGSSSGGSSSGGSSSGGSSSGGSSSGGALQNGQTVTGLSAAANTRTSNYYIDVPSGASNLSIKISGGTGDADLYVKKDSVPTDNSYDCRPYAGGNSETCGTGGSALPTSTGRFYINLKAYSAFSGVNLTASYTSGGSSSGGSSSGGSSSGGSSSGGSSSGGSSSGGSSSGGISDACATGSPSTSNSISAGTPTCLPAGSSSNSIQYRYILVPANTNGMTIRTQHGSGNGNLYYNASTWATASANTQSSTGPGNTETITVNNPAQGYRFISVIGQQSGMTLQIDLQ